MLIFNVMQKLHYKEMDIFKILVYWNKKPIALINIDSVIVKDNTVSQM